MDDKFKLFTSLRYDAALSDVPAKGWKHAGWNSENASALYMLDFHRDRMLRAATYWGWDSAIDAITGDAGLKELSDMIHAFVTEKSQLNESLRIRVLINRDGTLSCETFATPATPLENLLPGRLPAPGRDSEGNDPVKEPHFEVVIDDVETARSEYTHYKTTKRAMYEAARLRAGLSPTDQKEVLIVNTDNGAIMEGSTTTPYFWRDGRWVTPPVPRVFNLEQGSGGNDGTTRRYALER
jgi:4-amino-4-deoxychorismate lyase